MKALKSHLPCPNPECGSSDAFAEFDNGGYCYSCKQFFPKDGEENTVDKRKLPTLQSSPVASRPITIQDIPYRGHSNKALNKYGVIREVVGDEHTKSYYPYPSGWNKIRVISTKQFFTDGEVHPELFGMDKFGAGSAKEITITEGEEDAVAVYEMLNFQHPVVSVRSSASAKTDCEACYDYLNAFDKIYLCFDNDSQGQKAAEQVLSLFPFEKVYIVKLSRFKDANDYQIAGAESEFLKTWFHAKRHVPTNIISTFAEAFEILKAKDKDTIATFPFEELQRRTLGIRPGETYLFKAPEGIGKTEFFRAIEHHILKTTDLNIAAIHLEDPDKRIIQGIANYELGFPVHLKELNDVPIEEVFKAFQKACGRDERFYIYESLENDDYEAVLNGLRFLVSSGNCRVVFLDHITRLVTGSSVEDERRTLDRISTRLSQLAKELDFALMMISHVNDDGQTRGSRNISKEAWTVVSLERDLTSEIDSVRNTTKLMIHKNRHASYTGPAGELYFDPMTFMLSDKIPEVPSVQT